MSGWIKRTIILAIASAVIFAAASSSASAGPCELVDSQFGPVEVCAGRDSAVVGVDQQSASSTGGIGTGDADGVAGGPAFEWDRKSAYCGPDVGALLRGMDPAAGSPDLTWGCIDVSTGAPAVIDVAGIARRAASSVQVPEPVLVFGPEPSVNQWGVLAVGLPIWVWAENQGPIDSSVNQEGIDISLTASRSSVTIDWGDGTSSVCDSMTPRPADSHPMAESPDCGHVYQKRGDYIVTATASWNVSWAALGASGSLALSSTGSRQMPISEFEAVVVR